MKAATIAFEVLDALGLVQLLKRSGDLNGSVPLRVAQGCAPLFEGNAFGFQITLRQTIRVRRNSDRIDVQIASPYYEALLAAHRAVVPRLVTQGILRADGPFSTAFADSFVKVESRDCLRLWTGLCVRPVPGVWLRVSATANRRNHFIDVREHHIIDDGTFEPLILDVKLRRDASDVVRLEGEVGTVAPVDPGFRIENVSLADAPHIGIAHTTFFDNSYFDSKKAGPTRKYRKIKPLPEPSATDAQPCCHVITIGPKAHTIAGALPRAVLSNSVPFEASYDGYSLVVEPDWQALRAGARAVERAFSEALGPTFLGDNRRAMVPLTRYFTHHPPGEPHFFILPWVFMQTPPGWSCLLEGVHGDGFDILRGVVTTDVFHATPAVFHVYQSEHPIRLGFGQQLLHLIPIPRRLLGAGFRQIALRA